MNRSRLDLNAARSLAWLNLKAAQCVARAVAPDDHPSAGNDVTGQSIYSWRYAVYNTFSQAELVLARETSAPLGAPCKFVELSKVHQYTTGLGLYHSL